MKIEINKTQVYKWLKEDGLTKEDIRTSHYPELSKSQWAKALKAMNLNNVRAAKIDFVIVEDSSVVEEPVNTQAVVEDTLVSDPGMPPIYAEVISAPSFDVGSSLEDADDDDDFNYER